MSILQLINYRDENLTLNDRLSLRSKIVYGLPYGNAPLLDQIFPYDEVKAAFETFLNLGAINQKWDEFSDLFEDNAVYIADENTVWYGKEAIKVNLKNQLKKVPKMKFDRVDWYDIYQNRVTFYIWNEITSKSGKIYRIPNISIIYYAGNGKWKFEEDFYDKLTFMKRILLYGFDDLINGGEALWTLIKNSI